MEISNLTLGRENKRIFPKEASFTLGYKCESREKKRERKKKINRSKIEEKQKKKINRSKIEEKQKERKRKISIDQRLTKSERKEKKKRGSWNSTMSERCAELSERNKIVKQRNKKKIKFSTTYGILCDKFHD